MGLTIRQNLLPSSKYPIKSPFTMKPTRIVVHNTANDASANNEIAYMIRNDLQVSFHYAVDDVEAVQGVPENRNAWHAGDGDGIGNRQGIGIEICYSKSGGDRFIKAERNACILIAQLLKKYGWGIDKVTKHQDYSGKYCPHRTLDMGWNRFLSMVQSEINGNTDWKSEAIALPEDKKKYITNKTTALYKMDTGEVVKDYPQGLEVGVDYQYKDWYLTAYSFDRNIKNGFKSYDLDLKTVPEEPIEQPIPETPVEPSELEKVKKELEIANATNKTLTEEKRLLEAELKTEKEESKELNNNYEILLKERDRLSTEKNEAIRLLSEYKNSNVGKLVVFLQEIWKQLKTKLLKK